MHRALRSLMLQLALVCAACEERPAAVPETSTHAAAPAQGAAPAATEPTVPASVPVANAEYVISTQIYPNVKRCYDDGLRSDPTMEGRIVIRIEVDAQGKVSSAQLVMNEGLSPAVADCIAAVPMRARFAPQGRGGSTINVPFRFGPGSSAPGSVPPPASTQSL